jgi:protein-S-isoprenylcysteine O-methyltransferase Ste14
MRLAVSSVNVARARSGARVIQEPRRGYGRACLTGLAAGQRAGTGLAFTVAGLCFAVWARMHLGKYWSGRITLKENHRIIQTGPYAWVRHPIYSGLILALFGTAITLGTIPAFAGFAFMLISFVRKLKIEETWLRSQFGAEYEAYQNRVKALIPRF